MRLPSNLLEKPVQRAPASGSREGELWGKTLVEFRASAIPDDLSTANIEVLAGEDLLQVLTGEALAQLGGHAEQYATQEVQRITDRYKEVAAGGGWVCWGTTLDGGEAVVPVIKPFVPRSLAKGFGAPAKVIKYETPLKAPGIPILPVIPERYIRIMESRWGEEISRDMPVWRAIQENPQIPIAITEGVKKALALVAMGVPAIAVRGVTLWRVTGSDALRPELASFAQRGRKVFLFFDQDEKPKTQKAVFQQTLKLGQAYGTQGSDFRVVQWERGLGKGIDDVLAKMEPPELCGWFYHLLEQAVSLKYLKRCQMVRDALAKLENSQKLTYPVERHSEGRYLPALPTLTVGAIHAVSAGMGCGKTVRIGSDWVQTWRSKPNHFVIVLSPLNSLGQQTAKNWGLPHIHDFSDSENGQIGLESTMRWQGGLVLCPDSLHRLPNWVWKQHILLVLDEANQVLEHLVGGQTLGNRWSTINYKFVQLARQCQAIIACEAHLHDRAIGHLRQIAQKPSVRLFTHQGDGCGWPVTFHSGHSQHTSGFFSQLLAQLKAGGKTLFVSSSKFAGQRLEWMVRQVLPGIKTVRIDSDTNEGTNFTEFFENPDQWLRTEQPDLLICSPSVKSGVSIQGGVAVAQAYFQSVWGYFPSGSSDLHYQLLGRFRPAVPRHIYCPTYLFSDSDEGSVNPAVIRKTLDSEALALTTLLRKDHLLPIKDEESLAIQQSIFDFYAQMTSTRGHMKRASLDYLQYLLGKDGCAMSEQAMQPDPEIKKLMQNARSHIEWESAQKLSDSELEPGHTPEWAAKTLQSPSSLSERYQARKVFLKQQFPGVNFDDFNVCLTAVIEDYSALLHGVKLQAHAEDLEIIQIQDAKKITELLQNQDLKALHKLPRGTICAKLISALRILELLGQVYSNNTPLVQEIKAIALKHQSLIQRYLHLNVKPDQSGVHIVNKILKRLGLPAKSVGRPGTTDRDREYQVAQTHLREQLLTAYKQYLQSLRPQFTSIDSTYIQDQGRVVSTEVALPPGSGISAVQKPNPPPKNE